MNRTLSLLAAAALPIFAAQPPAATVPATPAAAPAAEIPIATFFRAATIDKLTFSPNGKYVACLVPFEHRMNLAIIDLEKGTKNLITNFKDRDVIAPYWANDERIVFRVDDEGQESFAHYAVNRDGKDPGILASGYSKAGTNNELNVQLRHVFGGIKGDTKNILVLASLTHRDYNWSDVATLNLKTGRMTSLIEAPGQVDYYLRDHAGQVRIAVIERDQIRRVLHRDPKSKDWVTLGEHHMDSPGWEPLDFDGDDRTLFIWSNVGRKTKAIYRYDTVERKQLDLVVADETYDIEDAGAKGARTRSWVPFSPPTIFDPKKNKIVGLAYSADRTRFHWLDDDMRKIQEKIETSLPDTVHRPVQFSGDGTKILYFSSSDRDPGVFYLYDRVRQKLSELAVTRPGIDPDLMAPVKAITFAARDGLAIHAYLALPKGRPAKNLPLLINPHGGPYGLRDEWRFNSEVQFYASRGFAVMQVDFRGSGGYGFAFEAAGFKKWGLEMQDDLTDAVKWAVAQGIADPARVVISGASYGGYAAMAGLTLTPEVYCAGINYIGVTDIELNIPRAAPPDRMYWRNTRLGMRSDASDMKRIHDTSPVHFADRIVAPLLMAYGKNDVRVNIDHCYDMERALKKAGKEYELIIESEEGHGFQSEAKKIAFFEKVDAFLKKNALSRTGSVHIGPAKVIDTAVKARE